MVLLEIAGPWLAIFLPLTFYDGYSLNIHLSLLCVLPVHLTV